MEAEMAAVADFFHVLSTVTQALDEASPPHERALRSKTSKSSKGTKKRSKNGKSVCKEELRQCREDSANADESYLYIQTAGTCHLERTPLGQGFEYFLVAALGESTYKFSDRPAMMEEVVATSDFVSDFASTFAGSPPNVGLTFVDEASGEFKDPVVVSASSPTMTGGVTTYKIDQSPFQQGVESLDSLFDNASSDKVDFVDCSLFFDSSSDSNMSNPPEFCTDHRDYPTIQNISLHNKCHHPITVDGWVESLEPNISMNITDPMCSTVPCVRRDTKMGNRINYWFTGYSMRVLRIR